MLRTLQRDFEALLKVENAPKRGRSFELLTARKLEAEGFRVYRNSKAAAPRQTDILASNDGRYFLIEVKWRRKPTDVSDIAALKDRLSRLQHGVIGCIFSMNRYSRAAITEVEQHRQYPILLFDAKEVNDIFADRVRVTDLLEQKQHFLLVDATVYFHDPVRATEGPTLPPSPRAFLVDSRRDQIIGSKAAMHDVCFVSEIPGISHVNRTEHVLTLRPSLRDIRDLESYLQELDRIIGLSPSAAFAIHQRSYQWFGFGCADFMDAVTSWRDRYDKAALTNCHHSEELAYFDFSDGRLIALTSRQRVSDEREFLHSSELEIWLPGVPVESKPYQELCRLSDEPNAHFMQSPFFAYQEVHFEGPRILLKPRATIVTQEEDAEWVSGLVVDNPFRRRRPKVGRLHESFRRALPASDILLCHLADWHLLGDVVDHYYLRDAFFASAGHRPVLCLFASWGDFVRRVPPPQQDWEAVLKTLRIPDVIE